MEEARQFRVALTTDNFENALTFYRDVVGLRVQQEWSTAHGRGIVLSIKEATLEILDRAHAEMVDTVEVGSRVSGQFRLAFQFADLQSAIASAQAAGARVLHAPVETPWRDLNARLTGPDGVQMTFFQVRVSEPPKR